MDKGALIVYCECESPPPGRRHASLDFFIEVKMKKRQLERRKKLMMDVLSNAAYRPMRLRELAALLDIPRPKRKELYRVMDELVKSGSAQLNANGAYVRAEKPQIVGTFLAHPRGFGFVDLGEGEEDIYIPEEKTGRAMDQDKVQVALLEKESGRRREGVVVQVLEHKCKEIVGTYQKSPHYGFVVPDNPKFSQDVFIPGGQSMGAAAGDKVVVILTSYGSRRKGPEGRIKEILGNVEEPGTDVLSIVKALGIPTEFSEKVIRQAKRVSEELIPGDFQGRKDIRDWTMVTIDGEDSKDLDDAVSLTWEEGENGEGVLYHLGVHIADVANYVQGGSAMDREALRRGTSVYLTDRVIPMLHQRLSNGICSLNAGEDRLALSCLMDVDGQGQVIRHEIAETVIRVDRRMTYTNVQKILDGSDPEVCREYADLQTLFKKMDELSACVRRQRQKRGSIDFNFPESKITIDETGKPLAVEVYEHNRAMELIEDFMILANETVAREFCEDEIPFLYRTHGDPDPDKVEELLTLIHSQGIAVQKAKEKISPLEIQRILAQAKGQPNEALISRLALRAMQQARYTVECTGHFGLASTHYCHFTSPIRRYPDLQIHRIIKDKLRGRMNQEKKDVYASILDEVATLSSSAERRAEEAEREVEKLKKAEYMLDHVGEEFEGVISGVTGWGLYVELPNTIEGLVHIRALEDDYYKFDEETLTLTGEATGKTYALGQRVRVRAVDVDLCQRNIDFAIE